jgi:hypothetical protein
LHRNHRRTSWSLPIPHAQYSRVYLRVERGCPSAIVGACRRTETCRPGALGPFPCDVLLV